MIPTNLHAGRTHRFGFPSSLSLPSFFSPPPRFFLFARKSSFGANDRIHDTRDPRFLEREERVRQDMRLRLWSFSIPPCVYVRRVYGSSRLTLDLDLGGSRWKGFYART